MITSSFSLTATERVLPKLALDFTTAILDPRVSFTRAGNTATVIDFSGNLATINADLPRFDYNPTTLICNGLLIEEARTNSLKNSTATGTVAGSPGTAPTNWFLTLTGGVFTRTIVGTGTENGIAYIDIRYQASGSGTASVQYTGGTDIAALNGQTWAHSNYVKLVGGSLTNVTVRNSIVEANATGSFLAGGDSANYVPTSAALITQRQTYARTNINASTAYVYSRTAVAFSGVGDVTLRFGLPQLELGAFSTSAIPTSGTALTRNADFATMTGTNFSSWYNQSQGTVFCSVILPQLAASARYVQMDDGTDSLFLATANTTTQTRFRGTASSGVAQYDISTGSNTANTLTKAAGAYIVDNFGLSVRSSAVATDLVGSVATVSYTHLTLPTKRIV